MTSKILCSVIFISLYFSGQAFSASIYEHAERTFVDAFDTTGLVILAAGAMGTAIAFNNDLGMQAEWDDQQKMAGNVSAFGDYYGQAWTFILPVVVGQLIWDRENGYVTTEGLAESFVILEGLKYGVGRPRPVGDNHSFPSGHTTISFSFAASMGVEYPWYIWVPAYGLAVFTGLSRIADNQHWLSDTVAGATLGMMFGRAGYKHHFSLQPLAIDDGGEGFGLQATFKF